MSEATLAEIEDAISKLAMTEQLWLIERVAHRLGTSTLHHQQPLESQLITMAADPDIQRELQQIDADFTCTAMDGLGID